MNGNSPYYVNRNGYSSNAQDNIDDRATQSQRPSLLPSKHPPSRHEIAHEEVVHAKRLSETRAQAYHSAAPLGRSQPPLPPPGPSSCRCWEYMPIGQHDPQSHGVRPGEGRMQEIVNAQAARERVAGCVCQNMGWPVGWHSRWLHNEPAEKDDEDKVTFQLGAKKKTKRKRESDAQDEGGADAEGSSAGIEKGR
ncbi:hypothetical protein Slin15195_G119240 [Septoria linicola]|uniref:Uncharacterized protein n=1 Tax=Septoria linicola TaxID=215465 RepID=A0A9Q9EQ00_9PEZI|nr:hypothetical protein Slin14017_G096230 [Septoria linicola]USW58605.1 hypothetical protein Slin15195_G119240 [Septoria linicola]